jgi:CRP-like cAMP-binding protein
LWLYARQIEDLRFRTVEERVAGLLSTLAARRAKVARSGSALRSESRRSVQLTHSEIADLVGAHRVSVTNSLRALEERGLVEVRPRRIVLRDPAGLLRLAARAGPESVAPGAGR